jgi:2-hydroxy-3-keto-5-methylthiopentenyl-1-phosphate phosphatase
MSIIEDKAKSCVQSVVFDLDSTLIYATEDVEELSSELPHHKINFRSYDDYEDVEMFVMFRPYVIELMEYLKEKNVKVGIWSVGKPSYVNEVCKLLPISYNLGDKVVGSSKNLHVDFIWSWPDCYRSNYKMYKPLSKCPFNNNHSKTCIVEDTPECCDINDRRIIVSSFIGDPKDECLLKLQKHLF